MLMLGSRLSTVGQKHVKYTKHFKKLYFIMKMQCDATEAWVGKGKATEITLMFLNIFSSFNHISNIFLPL